MTPARRSFAWSVIREVALLSVVLVCVKDSTMEETSYPPFFDPTWIKPSPAPPGFGVTLDCITTATDEALNVRYRITNTTTARYVVFNRLFPETATDPDALRIDFSGDALVLSKQVMPMPKDFRDMEEVPLQSILDPLGTIQEEFRVPLPAKANNYARRIWLEQRTGFTTEYKATRKRRTRRVTLVIGIMQVLPHMRVLRSWQAPDIFYTENADVEGEQIALTKTIVIPDEIEVLDYEAAGKWP